MYVNVQNNEQTNKRLASSHSSAGCSTNLTLNAQSTGCLGHLVSSVGSPFLSLLLAYLACGMTKQFSWLSDTYPDFQHQDTPCIFTNDEVYRQVHQCKLYLLCGALYQYDKYVYQNIFCKALTDTYIQHVTACTGIAD